jgi:hypothetical protein
LAAVAAAGGVLFCKLIGFSGPAILIGALLGIAAAMLRDRLVAKKNAAAVAAAADSDKEPR